LQQALGATRTNNPLHQDDFALFHLERKFDLNVHVLEERWKAMQRLSHPDKFASQSAAEQRVALQWSTRINEAYRRLRNPLSRAIYMSELMGLNIELQTQTRLPEDFLLKQMEWHEALQEATKVNEVERLMAEVSDSIVVEMGLCQELLCSGADMDSKRLADSLRAWVFMDRLMESVKARLNSLQSQP
jgi:molecular chaperone HscB